MNLLDRLREPVKSGLGKAVAEVLKVAAIALAGGIFNVLLPSIPMLNSSFWTTQTFTNAEVALWFVMTAAIAVAITHSMMRRRIARVEATGLQKEQEALELSLIDPATGLFNLRALNKRLPEAIARSRQTQEPLQYQTNLLPP